MCLAGWLERKVLSEARGEFLRSMQRGLQEFTERLLSNLWKDALGCLHLSLFGLGDQAACVSSPRSLPRSLASSLDLEKAPL